MNTSSFSKILLDKAPKKINNSVEDILDILFKINEVVRELNSIDFCNPLGYILTKALPPDGLVDKLLKEYGKKASTFVNKVTSKLELSDNALTIADDIEEIRISLEDLILPEELKDIVPGADGLTKLLQDLNDSLVITNTILSVKDKTQLIKSFSNRLIPFTNPINLTEALLANQAASINKQLNNIIKPERFRSSLLSLIKLVIKLDKSIVQIKNVVILMNKIIKTINTLIKIFKLSIKLLKLVPTPAKYVTVGTTTRNSSKVYGFEKDIDDLDKILKTTSVFLDKSVISQLGRIRNEIFILLVGLNQLLENLKACSYFNNDGLLDNLNDSITTLNNSIILIDELFPGNNNDTSDLYKGYRIKILKEETTDNNTNLFRRRVIVTNIQDLVEYEGTPTYTSNDQILIKEGQYYIDSKDGVGTYDNGVDVISDTEALILLKQIGMEGNSINEATSKQNQVNRAIYEQIQSNPEEKRLYDSLNGTGNINQTKVDQIKRILNSLSTQYKSPQKELLLQARLKRLATSLLEKGYTSEEIEAAFKYSYSNKFEIKIINNNITISKV
jgi:hypothetical protein